MQVLFKPREFVEVAKMARSLHGANLQSAITQASAGSNVKGLLSQVMAMRSPELMEHMPKVEAMSDDERAALVERGHANISALIKNWDKFADILMAQGRSKQEVKKKAKQLKTSKSHLESAMRLKDPKVILEPFRDQASVAFATLVAWFIMNMDYLENVLRGPKLTRQSIGEIRLPEMPAVAEGFDGAQDELVGPGIEESEMDGPADARDVDGDPVDLIDSEGGSHVHP